MQRGSGDSDHRTQEQVDDALGKVLVRSIETGGANRRHIRWLAVSMAFNLLLSVGVVFAVVYTRSQARKACERTNRQGVAYIQQWAPVLREPRPALREGATAAERRAYDANTALRSQFERDLRQFEPVGC